MLWFHIFPLAEWSYYLLAMLMPALALWIAWRLSADYLDGEKRVAGLALLTLVPFFNFHALKYNANTVLLPLWAAAAFFFLRSYRTRGAGWAALAGLAAAACMYGKYWSVVLLAGLALAALVDARRAAYFRSPAPWITAAVGLLALAPHLVWLWRHDFTPLTYAAAIHAAKPFGESLVHALGYLAGSLGYVAVPVAIALAIAKPGRALAADMIWPAERERRLAAAAFWAPLLLPAMVAPLTGSDVTSLWSMSAWTLLPVLLLSAPAIAVREVDTTRILAAAIALPILALIAAPVVAIMAQRAGPAPAGAHGRLLAQEIERQWRMALPYALRFVGGDTDLAYAVAAYARDAPRALPGLPPPRGRRTRAKRRGLCLLCRERGLQARGGGESRGARRRPRAGDHDHAQFPRLPRPAAELRDHAGAAQAIAFFLAHDLIRKPVPTFRDHALAPADGVSDHQAEIAEQRRRAAVARSKSAAARSNFASSWRFCAASRKE